MVVKHNMTAMNSNRMFNLTNKSQAKSTEKLSSGYKINRAADDAAGLSISEKMRRQIRGLTQASANASDGISCVQTLTTDDRSYITMEVRQLMSEIDRVQSTTTFNEQNLLDGSFTSKGLQVGAESGQHIAITIRNLCANDLIASALAKGICYQTFNDSPVCHAEDGSTAGAQPGGYYYQAPDPNSTTHAIKDYVDLSTIQPWGSPGHSHLLSAKDLTIFHSFSYSAITDENVKNRLTNSRDSTAPSGTEEALSDKAPDVRYFQALNAFAKSAIFDVSEVRSDLGAIQNRLEHTISNLDNIVENTTSAESAIRDTDIATEMVKYANNNILAQAGQSMLSQANQSNQSALSLLQ